MSNPTSSSSSSSSSSHSLLTQQPITPYIKLLTQTTDISSIQSIILKCISDPKVHVGFSELVSTLSTSPSIHKTLSESTIGQRLLRTLDLYSHGVFLDYKNNDEEGKFVKLNDGQELKLKLLTVVSIVQRVLENAGDVAIDGNLASGREEMKVDSIACMTTSTNQRRKNRRSTKTQNETTSDNNPETVGTVHYSTLKKALDINPNTTTSNTNRQLEDILIQCIYSNLLPNGTKLDQKRNCMMIQHAYGKSSSSSSSQESNSVLCRDVDIAKDLPLMISKLDTIYKKSESVKYTLNKALSDLNHGMREDVEKWKRVEEMIQSTKLKIAGDGSGNTIAGGGAASGLLMDIAENPTTYDSTIGGKRHLKRSRGGRSNRVNFAHRS